MTTRFAHDVQHEDVVDVVGIEEALRGWSCFESGHVFDARQMFQAEQDELRLWAMCSGNHPKPYYVSVSLNDGHVTHSSCSCPEGRECKHVAALLYLWIHDPEVFEGVDDWHLDIALWTKERLLAMIFAVAHQSVEIEALLQAEAQGAQIFSSENVQDTVDSIRFAPVWKIPELADELAEQGYEEQAVMLVRERIGEARSGLLVDWLIEHYEWVSDYASALTWARRRLDEVPRAPYYATVWSIAQRLGAWGELRPMLFARLGRANFLESIKALLLEGRFAEALAVYDGGLQQGKDVSDATKLRLAEIAETIDPDRAVALYSALIDGLIERRTRDYYRMAANLLARVEALYGALGRRGEWRLMFGEFIASYPRRPALFEELERVNLLEID